MSAVAGLLTIASAQSNDLVGEFQETIFVRNAKGLNVGSTLFGLMAKLKSEPSDNIEFNWFERDPVKRVVYTNNGAGYTTTATALLFDDGTGTDVNFRLANGHILRNDRTGEYVRVSADPTVGASNTVTVVRNCNGDETTGTAIVDNDTWTVVTLAKSEGENPTRSTYEDPSSLVNYIQTFNAAIFLANAFKGQVMRSDIEGPLTDRRIQALERISRDIEWAFLMGRKKKTTTSAVNGYVYTTGGLYDSLNANASANLIDGWNNSQNGGAGTGTTASPVSTKLAAFNAWMQNFMIYGSDAKLAFCGPSSYSAVSTFANSQANGYRIMQGEQVFGMHITTINTPFGELSLAYHPLLKESPEFNNWMFVYDLPMLVQKVFEPLFLEPDIQTPGQDSYEEQYRAKLGLKLKFANAFGVASHISGLQ